MSIETGFPCILTINWRKWDRRSLIRERMLIKERALIRKSTVIVNRYVAKLVSQCSGSYSLSVRRSIFYRYSRMSLTARKTGREAKMSVTRGGKSKRPPSPAWACARVNRVPSSLEKRKWIMIVPLRNWTKYWKRQIISIICLLSLSSNVSIMYWFLSARLEKTRFWGRHGISQGLRHA